MVVPKSTLQDRVSGHLLPGTKSGKKRYLGDDEEKELVDFLMYCACIGVPQTCTDAIAFVQDVCNYRGKNCKVNTWVLEAFMPTSPRSYSSGSSKSVMCKDAGVII